MTDVAPAPACAHPDFACEVEICRVDNPGGMLFMAQVRVRCEVCLQPFAFVGLPCGVDFAEPRLSVDHLELRAPITPEGVALAPSSIMGVRVVAPGLVQ